MWMYDIFRSKDVFVAGIKEVQVFGEPRTIVVYWDEVSQTWARSDLHYFRPPKEKH